MNYISKMCQRALLSKKFVVAVVILWVTMGFAIVDFGKFVVDITFESDYIDAFLKSYSGSWSLLPVFAPLLVAIPFAAQHIENQKSGTIKVLVSRLGENKYFNSIFFTNLIVSFLVFFVGMVLYLTMLYVFFSKNVDIVSFHDELKCSAYGDYFKNNPLAYVFLIIVHCSIVGCVFSTVGLSISYFINNKFIAWVSPFVISIITSIFALYLNVTKFEPTAVFDVTSVSYTTVPFIIGYVIVTLAGCYILSYIKFKKDMINDEVI